MGPRARAEGRLGAVCPRLCLHPAAVGPSLCGDRTACCPPEPTGYAPRPRSETA